MSLQPLIETTLFSSESGVKYFILGALSSGLLLYGSSLIYGFTGSIFLNEISQLIVPSNQLGITFGLAFLLAGIIFKNFCCSFSYVGA